MLSYFVSGNRSTRNLNHGSYSVLQLAFLEAQLFTYFRSGGVDDALLKFKFTRISHEWDHDLRKDLGALLLHFVSSFEDSLNLHRCDRRVADT